MTADSQNKDIEDPIKLKDEEKPSKFLRVITVSAYIFSVSFAALMLSLYYIFIWSPQREHTDRLEGEEEIMGSAIALSSEKL